MIKVHLPSSSPKVLCLDAIAPIIAASKHSAFDASIKFCLYCSIFGKCEAEISEESVLFKK